MQYTIECFKNTGFSPSNVPDSAALVRTASSVSLPAVWLLQNRDRKSVKVASTYDTVRDIDYCFIGDAYYWVTEVKMLNENTAELMLQPDYLTTVGINNIDISSGWCTRRHVTNDTLFSNVIEEPFTPSEPLKVDVDSSNIIAPAGQSGVYYDIVTSTVDLTADLTNIARTFRDPGDANILVAIPTIPPASVPTNFSISGTGKTSKVPGVRCYASQSSPVKENISAVRALGIEQAITGSYSIQGEYVQSASGGVSIDSLSSVNQVVTTNINPQYATVKNKKVFSGQFQKVCLASTASPSKTEFDAHDIWESGNYKFRIFADLMPGGKPYCRPSIYHGNTSNLFLGTVEGGVWQNQPISYETFSGSAIDTSEYLRSGTRDLFAGIGNTIKGVAGGAVVGGLKGAITGGLKEAGATIFSVADKFREHNVKHNIVAPEVVFAKASGLQNYAGNYFFAYRYRLSDNDTVRFDNYLTQFGYAVNEPLTKQCFTGRKYFNFVQCNGVNIVSSLPMSYRLGAIDQLEAGVRIWHTLPNTAAMYDNPIA